VLRIGDQTGVKKLIDAKGIHDTNQFSSQLVNSTCGPLCPTAHKLSMIQLDFPTFTLGRARQLTQTIPNVAELELYISPGLKLPWNKPIAIIIYLIQAWSGTLISLELRLDCRRLNDYFEFRISASGSSAFHSSIFCPSRIKILRRLKQVIHFINQLSSLERLTIDFNDYYLPDGERFDLSILSRLKKFCISECKY
jgi:hypothetical protein